MTDSHLQPGGGNTSDMLYCQTENERMADRQIILYEYQRTRNASHLRTFLKDYECICVTDGYQVYHTVEKELEDLTIAGCWVHFRRRFEEVQTVVAKEHRKKG